MKPKIILTKNFKLYPDQKKRIEALGEVISYEIESKSTEEWFERCKDANIICTGMFGFKSEKLYDLENVFISLPFVGIDFLDLNRLKEKNISISNAPGCNKEAVTEWMIGMLLYKFRNLASVVQTTSNKREQILQTGGSIYNKNIAILGAGNIGKYFGKVCQSLGAKVKFYKKGDNLQESVKNVDIIANCLGLNASTIGLLDRDFFFSLKKGTFFISIARQQIYDIEAMKEALDKNILSCVIDDSANTPIGDSQDIHYKNLISHPKIIATPHIAWNAESETRKSNDIMINNIESWIKNNPINLVQ